MSEDVDILVPQMVEQKIAEVVKVIPREPVSERTVEQIIHVPVKISHEQVQQRTVELEHSLEHETDEMSEKSGVMMSSLDAGENPVFQGEGFDHGLNPRRRLIRTALRRAEARLRELWQHAHRVASREEEVQPLKERVLQQTPEQFVDVPVVTQTGPHDSGPVHRQEHGCASRVSTPRAEVKTSVGERPFAVQATDPLNCKLSCALT